MPPPPGFQFQLLPAPPTQRYWFLTEDGTKLVQVQADRFMFNWRQVKGDEIYPRYESLVPEFQSLLETFLRYAAETAAVDWCELQCQPDPCGGRFTEYAWPAGSDSYRLEKDPEPDSLPPVEDTQLQQRFRIVDDDGIPVGRLYVVVTPALHQPGLRPAHFVTMLARGRPDKGGPIQGALHSLIARTKCSSTVSRGHNSRDA